MRVFYELKPGTPLTDKQRAQLEASNDRPIDFSDIPELPPDVFKNAVRGKFYRPVKQAVSLRLGCGRDRVAEEGRRRVSDAGEPDAEGEDAGRVEQGWVTST